MKLSKHGLEFIKQYEGFSSVPYLCPAEVWTIGYGHTQGINAYTIPITEETAEQWLLEDVEVAEETVRTYVNIPLTETQFDALVSLAFNIGASNFRRSTLLKKLNSENYSAAADEFLRWVFAGGKKSRGLEKRRKIERAMFLS